MDESSDPQVAPSSTSNVFEEAASALAEVKELVVDGSRIQEEMRSSRNEIKQEISGASAKFIETSQQVKLEVENLLKHSEEQTESVMRKVEGLTAEIQASHRGVLSMQEQAQMLFRETAAAADEARQQTSRLLERTTFWIVLVAVTSFLNLGSLIYLLFFTS